MSLGYCIGIPTYNNAGTVADVVRRCLLATAYPVVIIDDGSSASVRDLVACSERVTLIRFEENRGKGIALRAAIDYAAARGFSHLIAIDADGQHLPEELSKLVSLSQREPKNLIIGSRLLTGADVPGISKFGRKFSNFWVKVQTGAVVEDSQSGLRIYPLAAVKNLKFITGRFDFEIEVLVRLLWRGVNVTEGAVAVYYPPAAERVSHFDKCWDNARISLLNTYLVVLAVVNLRPLRRAFMRKFARQTKSVVVT